MKTYTENKVRKANKYVAYRENSRRSLGNKYWTGSVSEAGVPSESVNVENAVTFSSPDTGYAIAGSFGNEIGVGGPLDWWKIGPA